MAKVEFGHSKGKRWASPRPLTGSERLQSTFESCLKIRAVALGREVPSKEHREFGLALEKVVQIVVSTSSSGAGCQNASASFSFFGPWDAQRWVEERAENEHRPSCWRDSSTPFRGQGYGIRFTIEAFVLQLNLFEVSDLADKLKMGSRAQEYIRGRMQNTSTVFYVYLLHFAAQV